MAERPKDLVYAQDEIPPPLTLAALGFQHVAVIGDRPPRRHREDDRRDQSRGGVVDRRLAGGARVPAAVRVPDRQHAETRDGGGADLQRRADERIAASATGPVEIRIGSDAFDITVTFVYAGDLPHLPDARPKRDLVEEQSFVSGLSGYLSGIHADRIEQSAHGDQCTVTLLFRL